MQEWSGVTCLRFIIRTRAAIRDYIEFRTDGRGCFSSSIGRNGGRQVINLQNPRCMQHGIILHEIGHAIGFWHEQSRPDRNLFVTIDNNNIIPDKLANFQVRNLYETDNQGSIYDYGSIMHYGRFFFSANSRPTITVNNIDEYNRQGRPTLGQRIHLSAIDVRQANRLYNCRGSGVRGILTVRVNYALGVPNHDTIGNSEVYVRVSARDDTNFRLTRQTRTISKRRSQSRVNWYQTLSFGGRAWQNVEISIGEDDVFIDDRVTNPQSFSIHNGRRMYRHCNNVNCTTSLSFYVNLVPDGNDCSPNPCRNGATCIDLILNYRCNCRGGYAGRQCQYLTGILSIQARNAVGLPDRDGWINLSDPYMQVVAIDVNGHRETRKTRHITGTLNPVWNERIRFSGRRAWSRIEVTVYDHDLFNDDRLTRTAIHTGIMNLRSPFSTSTCSIHGCGGRAYYIIYFTP